MEWRSTDWQARHGQDWTGVARNGKAGEAWMVGIGGARLGTARQARRNKVNQKYRFRDSYRTPKGVSAEVAAEELAAIHEREGALTPPAVVEAARPKDATLHPVFEWDNKKAAEAYRINQARNLIRAVEIVTTTDGKESAAPVYVHIPTPAPNYERVDVVIQQPDQFALALMSMNRRLQEAKHAIDVLEKAARAGGDNSERLARIAVAARAIETAREAIAFH